MNIPGSKGIIPSSILNPAAICISIIACMAATVALGDAASGKAQVAIGANSARGNSDTTSANIDLTAEKKGGNNEIMAGAKFSYGKSGDEVNEENGKANLQYNRLLTDRSFLYLSGELSRDVIAHLDYRAVIGPGVGRYFLKSDNRTLVVEIGASYIYEDIDTEDPDVAETQGITAIRIKQQYTQALSGGSSIRQSLEALPRVDDLNSYLLTTELIFETAISRKLGIRITLQDRYDTDPAPDSKKNDISTSLAIVYRLNP